MLSIIWKDITLTIIQTIQGIIVSFIFFPSWNMIIIITIKPSCLNSSFLSSSSCLLEVAHVWTDASLCPLHFLFPLPHVLSTLLCLLPNEVKANGFLPLFPCFFLYFAAGNVGFNHSEGYRSALSYWIGHMYLGTLSLKLFMNCALPVNL